MEMPSARVLMRDSPSVWDIILVAFSTFIKIYLCSSLWLAELAIKATTWLVHFHFSALHV